MSLTPILSTYEDIGGVHSMQSRYSAKIKRYEICNLRKKVLGKRVPIGKYSKGKSTMRRILVERFRELGGT